MAKKTLREKLIKHSKAYQALRFFVISPYHKFYYKKLQIIGRENIPSQGPVIFVANHQNALMDALAILCTQERQAVFVARADIFKNPKIAKILHFIRILPIFRKRDGGNTVELNQETFDLVNDVLCHGLTLGMMPEGSHGDYRRLRPMQKGVFRIALHAQEHLGEKESVRIVPVGLNYEKKNAARKGFRVYFGEAIDILPYYLKDKTCQPQLIAEMQDDLYKALRQVVIHINSEAHYQTIDTASAYFTKDVIQKQQWSPKDCYDLLDAEQWLTEHLDAFDENKIQAFENALNEYENARKTADISNKILSENPESPAKPLYLRALLLLITLPVGLLSMLINLFPRNIAEKMAQKLIKDKQFESSVRFAIFMIASIIVNLLLSLICIVIFRSNFQWMLYSLAFIWFSKNIAACYYEEYQTLLDYKRYFDLKTKQPTVFNKIKELRNKALAFILQ